MVESIAKSVPDGEIELVVTDWMSTDWPIREWIDEAVDTAFSLKIVDIKKEWFSRGYGLNLAAEHAKSDILFFTDTDIIMTEEVLEDAIVQCSAGKAFYPICRHDVDHSDHDGWIDCGYGICAVTRDMWIKVGKWKEWSSWGGEDDAFYYGVRDNFEVHRRRYEGFLHMDHPKPMDVYEKQDKYSDYKKFMAARKKASPAAKASRARTQRRLSARNTNRTLRIKKKRS
jgi:glycosyltransferase involved in cell wall biosynthesis